LGITAVLNVQTDEDMAYWSVHWDHLEPYYRQAGVEVQRDRAIPNRKAAQLIVC